MQFKNTISKGITFRLQIFIMTIAIFPQMQNDKAHATNQK